MNKRELIIETAINQFVENGFHGTATAKIAQLAGVANGTLFQNFKTKDALIMDIFVLIKDEMATYVSENNAAPTDVKATVKNQIVATLHWALENPIRFHYIQQFHTSPYMNLIDAQTHEKYLKPHYALIEKGIEQNIIKPLQVDLLYALISNHTFGIYQFLKAKENLSQTEKKDTISQAFDMLWDMITH